MDHNGNACYLLATVQPQNFEAVANFKLNSFLFKIILCNLISKVMHLDVNPQCHIPCSEKL